MGKTCAFPMDLFIVSKLKIKKYRQLKGLNQERLASQTGVCRETIMGLEKVGYNPSFKLAVDISRTVVCLGDI